MSNTAEIDEIKKNIKQGLKEATSGCRLQLTHCPMSAKLTPVQRERFASVFEAEADSLRAGKVLISRKIPEVREVLRIQRSARIAWRSYTINYEAGLRLIRTDRIPWMIEVIQKHQAELADAVAELSKVWPQVVEEARERLGDLFDQNDYDFDPKDAIFLTISFPAIEPDRRMLAIAPEVYQAEQARLAAQFSKIAEDTQAAMEAEFAAMVASLADKLKPTAEDAGKKKVVRQATIDNIIEFANQWKAKSINPSEMDAMIEAAQKLAEGVDLSQVRKGGDGSRTALSEAFASLAEQAEKSIVAKKKRSIE